MSEKPISFGNYIATLVSLAGLLLCAWFMWLILASEPGPVQDAQNFMEDTLEETVGQLRSE